MFVLFSLGGKSLLSVALLAVVVLVEKEFPGYQYIRSATGVALLLAATWWAFVGL